MKDSVKVFLGFGIAAALIAAFFLTRAYLTRTIFNEGPAKGNTGSNLYNNGLFAASDNKLYFANPDDDFRLYVADSNGSNPKKLSDDIPCYINVDDHYIYYCRSSGSDTSQFSFLHVDTNSLCRMNKDGGKVTILDHDPDLYASLVGNYIYYIHYDKSDASTLYRTGIDGKGTEQVDKTPLIAVCSDGTNLYYSGMTTDFSIYRMNGETMNRTQISPYNSYRVVVDNSYAYYMDVMNGYALARTNLADQSTEILTTDRVDCFLVDGDTVIYQKNSKTEPALMRIVVGSENPPEKIADGNYHSLNSAYGMLYFMAYDNDFVIYRTTLTPGGVVGEFHPGREAG